MRHLGYLQDLTDTSGRKSAADLLDLLLRVPQTFASGSVADRFCRALAELAVKVQITHAVDPCRGRVLVCCALPNISSRHAVSAVSW